MNFGISGRRALVCGGSSGLGLACAQALAAEGVHLTLVARRKDRLHSAAEAISSSYNVEVDWKAIDLSSTEDRRTLIESSGRVDILITNAGGPPALPLMQLDRGKWLDALEMNFLSAFELIHGILPNMIDRRFGRIVNITSASVKTPLANLELSTGARMALTGYVAGISREVAKFNVAINNLLPGPILTDRVREVGAAAERMIAEVPAGRAGAPEEFGAACAFLCSNAAAFIVGQNLCIDGGLVKTNL